MTLKKHWRDVSPVRNGLDLFARRLVAEELDLCRGSSRAKTQHEFAEAAVAGPFGKSTQLDDADDVRRGLRGEDPDQVADQEMAGSDLLPGIDDEPRRRPRPAWPPTTMRTIITKSDGLSKKRAKSRREICFPAMAFPERGCRA